MTKNLTILLLIASAAARADFSYTMTSKNSMGGNPAVSKYFYKGQKMKLDTGSTSTIMDFDAQTLTTINAREKTYTVKSFAQLGEAASKVTQDVQADVKETGQHKVINGFNASQLIMTMAMDSPSSAPGMKMTMEMEIWISPDVPGSGDVRAFYQRNISKYPWSTLGEGTSPSMRAAMVNLQKKLASMNGVTVLQVMHMKAAGAADTPNPQDDPRMAQARAKLEEMAKQGGPAGAAAQQQLARMGGGAPGGGMQITQEGGGYSNSSIPDSEFAIPAGFRQLK
jgi:Domain of unknown function (DUF4412)